MLPGAGCEAFGARFSECLTAACPAIAGTEEVLTRGYTHVCNELAATGQLQPGRRRHAGGQRVRQPGPGRDHRRAGQRRPGRLLRRGPRQRPRRLPGRLRPGLALHPPPTPRAPPSATSIAARSFCLQTPMFDEAAWRCAAEAAECGAVFRAPPGAGSGPAPRRPRLRPFGERVSACVVETCENAGEIADGVAAFAHLLCNGQVAGGTPAERFTGPPRLAMS
ncbi:MAG: hypothetical protein R3F43_21900 [bacterium]